MTKKYSNIIMLRMLMPAQGFVYAAVCFMVWIFYIPSQVLLTSSYLADRANADVSLESLR